MAQVTVNARIIEDSLVHVSEKIAAAIKWVHPKQGEIKLKIPEPYEHVVRKPSSRKGCFAPPPPDVCGDIAILIGVFEAMPKKGI
jgi:hypothetical protein